MEPAAWWYPILFGAGAGAGFIDAIVGGGGLVTVPVLLWSGLPVPAALATNKLQSTCGTALATWNYARAGLLEGGRWRTGVLVTFAAAAAGTACVTRLDPGFLRRLVPFLLLGIGIYTAFRPALGTVRRAARIPPAAFAWGAGTVLGFYDGFFGPGTGAFWMLACVLGLGLDLRTATGHTKVMNLTSNAASLLAFLVGGEIAWGAGLVMAAGQLLGAHVGSKTALRSGTRIIRPLFLAVVLTLSGKLLVDAFRNPETPDQTPAVSAGATAEPP